MKKNIVLLFFIVLLFNSCLFRKNDQYAKDLTKMNEKEFAEKYLTLYNHDIIDFSRIKNNQAYYVLRNGSSFQIIVFSDNGFIYETPLMPSTMLIKSFSSIQLCRSSYFLIMKDMLKIERMAASPGNVYSVIEEGKIGKDTIFMRKKYNSKGMFKNKRNLFEEYILIPEVKVYKIGSNYFIEK